MDCCCLWVKNPSTLVDSLSTSPEILRNKATESKKVVDYKGGKSAWREPRRSEEDGLKLNWKLLEEVNSSGKAFMTRAVVDGTFLIRCAIEGTFTEERHIDGLWKLIQERLLICYYSRMVSI
ncbi:Tyrosine/DOPA decarboxylase 3 [Camellia lanceoleosa]|uniref:Tyrosine/DOPA decarboxylase 3 n=1 Tax=Camellia lanceoleosa TaxID=1840588 RepID=A0ACC0H409_9ERIC|nr:Tyrosine/DOPA decarboxylase 3 [Camellia lanceoleosa]